MFESSEERMMEIDEMLEEAQWLKAQAWESQMRIESCSISKLWCDLRQLAWLL